MDGDTSCTSSHSVSPFTDSDNNDVNNPSSSGDTLIDSKDKKCEVRRMEILWL